MESWVGLGYKEGHTIIQISAEPGLNWGPCGQKAEILQLCQPCPPMYYSVWITHYDKNDVSESSSTILQITEFFWMPWLDVHRDESLSTLRPKWKPEYGCPQPKSPYCPKVF